MFIAKSNGYFPFFSYIVLKLIIGVDSVKYLHIQKYKKEISDSLSEIETILKAEEISYLMNAVKV